MFSIRRKKTESNVFDNPFSANADSDWKRSEMRRYVDADDSGICPQCGRNDRAILPPGWAFRGNPPKLTSVGARCVACENFAQGQDEYGQGPY